MRVGVCVKQVPDTSSRLSVPPGGLEPEEGGVLPVINPYDEFALEAALLLREACGLGEVVLLTLDRRDTEETIFHGLAMGADRAVALELPAGSRPSLSETGRLLAEALSELDCGLVFCGERAVDDDSALVPALIAERLGRPLVGGVETAELEPDGRSLRARVRRGDEKLVYSCPLPCVVSFVRGPALPRYAPMDGIFSARGKPVVRRSVRPAADAEGLRRVALLAPSDERARRILTGGPEAAAGSLWDAVERAALLR